MKKSKRILKVPKESFWRNRLRKEAAKLVEEVGVLPPARFEWLEQLAFGLIEKLGAPAEYVDFAIVLIGNESWRKTVNATPMHRRLLLLPQCLKDNASCKGVFDELGLNCAGCKACPIDDILIDAEQMGYATLVAEGTTVAVGLVEEGAIDAVIGVSCMPVLQRSFDPVSNAAVPVIGLPLMYDGCENTKIDNKWLTDEIRSFEEDKDFQPISVSLLKSKVQEYFTDEKAGTFFSESGETEKLAKEYLLIDGQRMRPVLAGLSYLAYSGDNNENILFPLAMIIECFHKASLIHDDIEDNADYRYDVETAHKKYGIPQAINAGDYLIGKGYELLAELPADGKLIAKSLKRIAGSHVKLTRGQGADILMNTGKISPGAEETLQIFKLKTGEAIKVALVLGAILGGADDKEIEILERFSDLFGIAYQIRDDLNEYKEKYRDEKVGDFPFLVALLNEHFSGNGELVAKDAKAEVSRFRQTIDKLGLAGKAENILDQYVENCYAELDKLANARLRLSLYGVIGKVFKPINVNELE